MKSIAKFTEGVYTPEQVKNLEHLAQFAPNWYWFEKRKHNTGKTDSEEVRASKSPRSPHGGNGSVDDMTTAGTLAQALKKRGLKGFGGVGCEVSTGVPGLVGIDVDNVIHDGDVHPIGREVIRQFAGAYVEVSPSGTGLRIFCMGTKPDGAPKGSTAIGQKHHGIEIKFEIYASGGAGRYLRVTGLTVESTGGGVALCQTGIDWFCGVLAQATANKAPSASKSPNKVNSMSIDTVFEELAELRPALELEALETVLRDRAGRQPRGAWANVWRGCLTNWKGDHSNAAKFLCCEIIRRGAGHSDDVVSIWGESGLLDHDKQEKFKKRPEWVVETIDDAARSVLVELQDKAAKAAKKSKLSTSRAEAVAEISEVAGSEISVSGQGRITSSFSNIAAVLRAKAPGSFAYDEFQKTYLRRVSMKTFDAKGTDKLGRVTDDDYGRVALWLSREFGIEVKDLKLIREVVHLVAKDNSYDPVADRFHELARKWEVSGKPKHLDTWLTRYAKVDDMGISAYVKKVSRCALIHSVRRVLVEGSEIHAMPILIANGGDNKGHLLKALADTIGPGLYQNQRLDLGNARNVVETAGRALIVEWADMSTTSDVGAFKAAMTQQSDTDRKAYGYESEDYTRRFALWGSANEVELITDPTLGQARRMWPLYLMPKTKADIVGFKEVAELLWGEAAWHALHGKERHFFDESDSLVWAQWLTVISKCRVSDPVEEALDEYLEKWARAKGLGWMNVVSSNDIASAIHLVDPHTGKPKRGDFVTLAKLLTARGLVQTQTRGKLKAWKMTPEVKENYSKED